MDSDYQSLPKGWTVTRSPGGKLLFANTKLNRQTMMDVRPLPKGWEIVRDAAGLNFFINHNTHSTDRTDPRPPIQLPDDKLPAQQQSGPAASLSEIPSYEIALELKERQENACCEWPQGYQFRRLFPTVNDLFYIVKTKMPTACLTPLMFLLILLFPILAWFDIAFAVLSLAAAAVALVLWLLGCLFSFGCCMKSAKMQVTLCKALKLAWVVAHKPRDLLFCNVAERAAEEPQIPC